MEKNKSIMLFITLAVALPVVGLTGLISYLGSQKPKGVEVVEVLTTCQRLVLELGYEGIGWGSIVQRQVFETGDINVVRNFTAETAFGDRLPKIAYCKYRVDTGQTKVTVE